MRQISFLLCAVVALLGGPSCRSTPQQPDGPSRSSPRQNTAGDGVLFVEDRDYIQVNGDTLTVKEVLEPLEAKLAAGGQSMSSEAFLQFAIEQIRNKFAAQLQELLLHQEASRDITERVTEVLDRYVDQDIKDRVNREFAGRQSRFEQHLAAKGQTLENARDQTRRRIIVAKYVQEALLPRIADPTRQELLDLYDANLVQYVQAQRRELYLIDIPKGPNAERPRSTAAEAQQRLRDGATFEEVAQTHSQGIHAAAGGYWGYISSPLQGRYAKASATFFELAAGQTSDVIETDEALFIVKVGEVFAEQRKSFKEAQPELVQHFREAQFDRLRRELIQSLFEKAIIQPPEGVFLKKTVATARRRYAARP